MAEVWQAEERPTGRHVALKIILDAISDDPKFGKRFLREARVLARLSHPHILPVYDFGNESGTAYLVTPLLLGGSMAERLRSGVSVETALTWLKRLASALDFAHAAGVIHRDVKPTNVLFDTSGQLFLCDFGLAKAASSRELTTTGAMMGTPLYMSPEQVRGDSLDSRTDVYGLGIVAYQLLSGQRPFAGDSVATVLHKSLNVMPAPPSSLNPALHPEVDTVILRALAKNRNDRYDTCEGLVLELEQALAGMAPPEREGILQPSEFDTHIETASVSPRADRRGARKGRLPSSEVDVSFPNFTAVTRKSGSLGGKLALTGVILTSLGLAIYFVNRPIAHSQLPTQGGAAPLVRLMIAKRQVQNLIEALSSYGIEHGRFPTGPWGSAWRELVPAFGAKESMPSRDPWGQAYRYAVSNDGKTYVVLSPGNDGVYQNSERVVGRLLESGCRTANEVVSGDDSTTDIVVCKGRFLTLEDLPAGAPR